MDTAQERRLGRAAGRQDNVITRSQLRELGFTDRQIAWRAAHGLLFRLHRGVYLAGYAPPTLRGRARAAMLACGAGAVLSHRVAAALWGFGPPVKAIDVTVTGRNPGLKPGVLIHRVSELPTGDARVRYGLRLTSPARTIFDLAATERRREVEYALQEAIVARLLTEADLRSVTERRRSAPGTALMRSILGLEHGVGFTRSEAERMLMRVIREAGLPHPEKNVHVEGHRVDALWRGERLIVEVDGRKTHAHALAFEADRRRDQELLAAGWRVIRVTYIQLRDEPVRVAAALAAALSRKN